MANDAGNTKKLTKKEELAEKKAEVAELEAVEAEKDAKKKASAEKKAKATAIKKAEVKGKKKAKAKTIGKCKCMLNGKMGKFNMAKKNINTVWIITTDAKTGRVRQVKRHKQRDKVEILKG